MSVLFFCLLIAQALTGLFLSLLIRLKRRKITSSYSQNKNVSKPHNSQLSMRLEVVSSSRLIDPNTFTCLITGASTNSLGDGLRHKSWELSSKKSSLCVKPTPVIRSDVLYILAIAKKVSLCFFKIPDKSNILGQK